MNLILTHDTREKEGSRVGHVLASDSRCGTVNGLEEGSVLSNVARRGKTKTTNKTGAHVGENVTVQVGHHHDAVGVWCRVLNDAEASSVEEVLVVLNVGVFLCDLAAGVEEHAVRHLPAKDEAKFKKGRV